MLPEARLFRPDHQKRAGSSGKAYFAFLHRKAAQHLKIMRVQRGLNLLCHQRRTRGLTRGSVDLIWLPAP
jgi:hypothetical protein